MSKIFSIISEKKEVMRLLEQISNILSLASPDFTKIENLISIRYLIRKRHITPFCKLIHSSSIGMRRCEESDRLLINSVLKKVSPAYHLCHAGLIDFCFPLVIKGKIIPLIGGQILFEPLSDSKEKEILNKVKDLNIKKVK